MGTAFLFPGQGSQYPGMLHDLPEHSIIEKTVQEASDVLKQDVLLLDTSEQLKSTVAVQICLLVSGVSIVRLLQEESAHPDMAAGHSVGAFGAAVTANVLSFQDALALVKRRGELMEQAYPKGYGMGVVLGMQEKQLSNILCQIHTPENPVYIANLNSSSQMTIAGELSALKKVFEAVKEVGARKVHMLNVSVPSHCPLLKSVSGELSKILDEVSLKHPDIPYAGNRTARPLRTKEAIKEDLASSVSHPVRWHEATTVLFELGARLYVEMIPGRVLTNLAKEAFPEARAVSVSDSGWKTASILIKRHKELS
ncbi:malonate decarboxylase subunit epsilon [Scopulibacillus cellulosilyticus]|uniref:Malonyl CoA-acyl carrier protein transacylase n=1 Tax=Scopulibacillus cellulosilyticus TaxID=2665665 RepID=A0ABW2Q169_9BACL